jgi:hypothetical protein
MLTAALAAQILIISVVPDLPRLLGEVVHLATYGLAGAFLIYNRRLLPLWIVAAGFLCNVVGIAANGGVLPASESALRRAGFETTTSEFENSAVVENPRLEFLGDIFAVPEGMPFANVFSIGDVLIVLGAVLTLHACCGSRLAPALGGRREPRQLAAA